MEQERCYVCRRPIPDGAVYRRVMPTAHYTGGNMGSASGVFAFTRSEVVSLCVACDAAEARRAVWRPGWGLKALALWCIVAVWVSAFLRGYWVTGAVVTGLVLWRIGVRWQQRRTPAVATPSPISPGQHPTRLTDHRVVRASRECPGDGDA